MCQPLAPNPPCKQVLAVVGVGSWVLAAVFSSLRLAPYRVRMAEPYPQTTLRAVARRHGGR